jgi:phosphoribosylformylglycinamidine synthase I
MQNSETGAVRALVLRSAGTNCDAETVRAFQQCGAQTDLLHLNAVAKDPACLEQYQIIAVAGGFSYGDYVAAGRVFGNRLRHQLQTPLRAFVERGGLMIGICNGFQILVELGMLQDPGLSPAERTIALTDNASNKYECRWVSLRSEESRCPFIQAGDIMPTPIAHAEGRFMVKNPEVLAELKANGQIALTYVDPSNPEAQGDIELPYPLNPNGSVANIAGICDPTGRVLGLMPHPERNLSPYNHPQWTRMEPRTEGEGLAFYQRMVAVAAESHAPA